MLSALMVDVVVDGNLGEYPGTVDEITFPESRDAFETDNITPGGMGHEGVLFMEFVEFERGSDGSGSESGDSTDQ